MALTKHTGIHWESELEALVRPLTARLNQPILASIARHLHEAFSLPPDLRQKNPQEVAAALQGSLLRMLGQWRRTDRDLMRDMRRWRELYYRTPEGENRDEILRRNISQHSREWSDRVQDIQAMQRQFDWEAMEERLANEQWDLWTRQIIALEAIEALYRKHDDSMTSLFLVPRDDMLESIASNIVEALVQGVSPLVRKAAVRALLSFVTNVSAARDIVFHTHVQTLIDRLDDKDEDRWVRSSLIRVLGVLDQPQTIDKVSAIMLDSDESGDRFLLRARAVATIAGHSRHANELRAELAHLASDENTGEYVRIALIDALHHLEGDEAFDLLNELAELENSRSDSIHTVRARYAQAIAKRLGQADFESHSVQNGARLLGFFATHDTNSIVRRIAQEALQYCLPEMHAHGMISACGWIVSMLDKRLHLHSEPGEAERISGLFESFRIAADSELGELYRSYSDMLAVMTWGARKTINAPEEFSQSDIMRVFANISRNDIGIYTERNGDKLSIQRGERFGMHLWRAMHEFRNRRPRKRPDITHLRGRSYRFTHRAHPEILAEVNPTEIPGERRFIEQEGGWARYLPMPDDLLECREPIKLYSSFGVTTITPPSNPFVQMRNRLRIPWEYASINAIRYQTIRRQEGSDPGDYVRYLKRRFGMYVDFQPWKYTLCGVRIIAAPESVLECFPQESEDADE